MALAFPIPVYLTTVSSPAPFTANIRALSTTSPGTTDSTATNINGSIATEAFYLKPEQVAGAIADAPAGSPPSVDNGYLLPINPTLAPAGSGITVDAGNWTIPYHYSRNNGFLSGDVTGTVTAILARIAADGITFRSEIGRSAERAITFTASEQIVDLIIPGTLTVFQPGEHLMLLLYVRRTGALITDTARVHTNSANGTRISAAPAYTRQYNAGISDSCALSESVGRFCVYKRPLNDDSLLTEALRRQVGYQKVLNDNVATTDAGLGRVVAYQRKQSDDWTITDAVGRRYISFRYLNDGVGISEYLNRKAIYQRGLLDALAAGGGTTVIAPVFNVFA